MVDWGGRGAGLRIDSVGVSLDMPFIRCIEELLYMSPLAEVTVCNADVRDEELTTQSELCRITKYDRQTLFDNEL